MPPTPDEYRAGLLLLQQQQRAKLTALIEQVDRSLAADWQRAMGSAAALYRPVIDAYARELAALRKEMDDPSAKLTLDWLTSRNSQLATIERSVRASLDTYGQQAAARVTSAQAASAERGAADAAQLTQRSLWPAVEGAGVPPAMLFNRPNPDAIAQWVGRAGNGHPLSDLFSNFGTEATQLARKEMLLGLATGANPKAMAAGIANALGVSRSRATIISRTEVLGSYRSAAHETYRANADVINGWLWSAGGNNPCFPAGTLITTKRGTVPIEAVRIGDEVLTHELRFQPVTGWTTRLYTGEMVDMCAAGQQVTATTEHPFLVQQRYGLGWLAAGRLRRGDYVVRDGSDSVVVDAIVHYDMDALSVYNLSVAADESYIANGFVVHNCAMCMGMDGLQFSLEEELVDHPCGRCSPVPITKSWDDILGPWDIDSSDMLETSMGAPGAYESGEERFRRMSARQQRAIIGTRTGYDAYRRGEVTLKDFIGMRPGENGFPAMPYQKSLKEMEIPTGRAGSNLVERAPRLTELEREGNLRYRDFGAPIPPDEMPKWAQQSPATEAVYQILRNGLPWTMREQELPLLTQNLEQMLKEELPLNVRLAALRQQDVLKQYDAYLERYVRHVTGGASTLGKAPEFVYTPSKELERALAVARHGETGIAQVAETAAVRQTAAKLTDAEFRDAVLAAHVRNADSSGFSAIRQIRNEVVQQTGISRAEFDARLRAWYDATPRSPDDLVAHLETNMDAHPGIRGRLTVDGTQYDFLQLSRGSEFERIIAGEAPAGNAYAGSLRGITREAFERELGMAPAATSTLEQEIAGAAINLDRMTTEQLAQEEAQLLKAIRPYGTFGREDEQVAEALGKRLANNTDFAQVVPKLNDFFHGNLSIKTPEEGVGALMRAWSGGTDNPISAALRLAIQEEFGLTDTARMSDALLRAASDWADVQPGLRAFVREMYNNTQDWLKEQGITEMPLFRGNTLRQLPESIDKVLIDGQVHQIQVALQSAASFTADEKWALEFASFSQSGNAEYGIAMAGRVPAELVLSTAQTGLGNVGEAEVLLLGGNYDLAMIGTRLAETPLTPEDIASLLTARIEQTAARAGERAGLEDVGGIGRVGRAFAPSRVTVSDAEAAARAEVKAARSTVNSLNRELNKALESGEDSYVRDPSVWTIDYKDVPRFVGENPPEIPPLLYHITDDAGARALLERGIQYDAVAGARLADQGRGFYMTPLPFEPYMIYGKSRIITVATDIRNPRIFEAEAFRQYRDQLVRDFGREWDVAMQADLERGGFDALLVKSEFAHQSDYGWDFIVAKDPGSVRIVTDAPMPPPAIGSAEDLKRAAAALQEYQQRLDALQAEAAKIVAADTSRVNDLRAEIAKAKNVLEQAQTNLDALAAARAGERTALEAGQAEQAAKTIVSVEQAATDAVGTTTGEATTVEEQVASTEALTPRDLEQLIADKQVFTDPNTGRTDFWTAETKDGDQYIIRPADGPNSPTVLTTELAEKAGLGEYYVSAQTTQVDGMWYEVQRMLAGQQADAAVDVAQLSTNAFMSEDERMRVSLFSSLLGDGDRYANNMWITSEGKLLQIDYNMVFSPDTAGPISDLLLHFPPGTDYNAELKAFGALRPSEAVMTWLRQTLTTPEMRTAILDAVRSYSTRYPGELADMIDAQQERLKAFEQYAKLKGSPPLSKLFKLLGVEPI